MAIRNICSYFGNAVTAEQIGEQLECDHYLSAKGGEERTALTAPAILMLTKLGEKYTEATFGAAPSRSPDT